MKNHEKLSKNDKTYLAIFGIFAGSVAVTYGVFSYNQHLAYLQFLKTQNQALSAHADQIVTAVIESIGK